jgi:transcriptional regulator GlxA family with amidase domain
VLDAVSLDPSADHSLTAMASRANFSVRHLSRLFEEHLGMSAASYVERVRLEAARAMLESGDEGVEVVARRAGFGSVETMRRSFVRDLGVSPGAYRAQFRTTGIDRKRPPSGRATWPVAAPRVAVSPSSTVALTNATTELPSRAR